MPCVGLTTLVSSLISFFVNKQRISNISHCNADDDGSNSLLFFTAIVLRSLHLLAVVIKGTPAMWVWWHAAQPSILTCRRLSQLLQLENTSAMCGDLSWVLMLLVNVLRGQCIYGYALRCAQYILITFVFPLLLCERMQRIMYQERLK